MKGLSGFIKSQKFNQRFLLSALFAVAAATTTIAISVYRYYFYNQYSLDRTLSYYGFTSLSQQQALESLFLKASIIPVGQSWPEVFPIRHNETQLVEDVLKMVKQTQEKFIIRTGTQERWEISPLEWMEKDQDGTLENLRTLGFVDAIEPKTNNVDAICILGATKPAMAKRIKYVESLINSGFQTKTIILLAGERYVTKDVDGSEDELSKIAQSFGMDDWKKLTETHLIRHLYNTSSLYTNGFSVHIIDTPKGDLPRPTTQTTTTALISWMQEQKGAVKSLAFISNQPHVHYQAAIIKSIFREQGVNIQMEVLGSSALIPAANSQGYDIKTIVGAFGSYIWAALPQILSDMKIKIDDSEIKKAFKELYSANLLVYNTLPKSFRE